MLTLHYHPLSSYCQKALIGLYELDVPFTTHTVDLLDPTQRAAFLAIAPLGKFPVLVDEDGAAIAESTILLEHVDRERRLFPSLAARARDRFWDLHVHHHMQTLVGDRLRAEGERDPVGVARARAALATSYAIADGALADRAWAAGDTFTIADCAAAPALFFARTWVSIDPHPRLAAYFDRLAAHPSVARTFAEAAPYLSMVPR